MTAGVSRNRELALLLGGFVFNLLLFSLNHIVAVTLNHGDYTPFSVDERVSAQVYDETQLYAPGPSRFLRGGKLDAELDLVELRGVPNAYPVLHTFVIGFLARATGSLEAAWMVGHAVFPALIWSVFFWVAWRATRSWLVGAAIAWATCLFAFGPRNALLLGMYSLIQPLELARIPQPGISFLFLLVAILLFSRALRLRSAAAVLLSGISAGLLFYAYYFYWIAFFAGAAVLLLMLLALRRRELAKTAAAAIALGSLCGAPYVIWTFLGMHAGLQQNLMRRVGGFNRQPEFPGLVLAALFLVLLFAWCKRRVHAVDANADGNSDRLNILLAVLLAVVAGSAIGINFQLLSGYNAQHDHFYNRAIQPLATFTFALWIATRKGITEKLSGSVVRAMAGLVILALLTSACIRQIQSARTTAGAHRQSSPEVEVLLWTRSHLSPDAVLGASDRTLLTLIPAIAGAWNFVPVGDRTMASDREILTRYLVAARLEDKSWPQVESALTEPADDMLHPFTLSGAILVNAVMSSPELELARRIWDDMDLSREMRSRRLDYLITRETPGLPPSGALAGDEVVYRNSAWRVVRITAQSDR